MPRNPETKLTIVTKENLYMKYLKVKNVQIRSPKAIKIFKRYMKSFHIFYDAWVKSKSWLKITGIVEYLAGARLKLRKLAKAKKAVCCLITI